MNVGHTSILICAHQASNQFSYWKIRQIRYLTGLGGSVRETRTRYLTWVRRGTGHETCATPFWMLLLRHAVRVLICLTLNAIYQFSKGSFKWLYLTVANIGIICEVDLMCRIDHSCTSSNGLSSGSFSLCVVPFIAIFALPSGHTFASPLASLCALNEELRLYE